MSNVQIRLATGFWGYAPKPTTQDVGKTRKKAEKGKTMIGSVACFRLGDNVTVIRTSSRDDICKLLLADWDERNPKTSTQSRRNEAEMTEIARIHSSEGQFIHAPSWSLPLGKSWKKSSLKSKPLEKVDRMLLGKTHGWDDPYWLFLAIRGRRIRRAYHMHGFPLSAPIRYGRPCTIKIRVPGIMVEVCINHKSMRSRILNLTMVERQLQKFPIWKLIGDAKIGSPKEQVVVHIEKNYQFSEVCSSSL